MATRLPPIIETKTRPLLSNEEILKLCHAATGGARFLDETGCIRIENQDLPLCHGDDHDVTWITPADAEFTTRMSPYQVACLVQEAQSGERRSNAYAGMLREHGFNPNQALFPSTSQEAPMPVSDQDSRPWPRVDQFMSDEDLTAAAERIRSTADWSKLPKLAAIFAHRPAVNRYWHELVALTLLSLEVNGEALAKRNGKPSLLSPTDSELDGIESLCKRATPGTWSSTTGCGASVHVGLVAVDKPGYTAVAKGGFQLFEIDPDVYLSDEDSGDDTEDRATDQAEADVRFIAAMSPLNTLRLIAHIRELKRQLQER